MSPLPKALIITRLKGSFSFIIEHRPSHAKNNRMHNYQAFVDQLHPRIPLWRIHSNRTYRYTMSALQMLLDLLAQMRLEQIPH